MPSYSIKDLRQHVQQLRRTHKIRKVPTVEKGLAMYEANTVGFREIKSRTTYAIALHEIGHLLSHSRSKPRLFQEGEAWAWAIKHALEWTSEMETAMVRGLQSYVQWALSDHQQNLPNALRLPPADHPFWTPIRHLPEARRLLWGRPPHWLNASLPAVPWGVVLANPDRPRCSNCQYWKHTITQNQGDTPEKASWGECMHKNRPLGVEMSPGGALCGTSWIRRL